MKKKSGASDVNFSSFFFVLVYQCSKIYVIK